MGGMEEEGSGVRPSILLRCHLPEGDGGEESMVDSGCSNDHDRQLRKYLNDGTCGRREWEETERVWT